MGSAASADRHREICACGGQWLCPAACRRSAANGMMMPSRRRTPTPNAPARRVRRPQRRAERRATARTATRGDLVVTGAEYTPACRRGGSDDDRDARADLQAVVDRLSRPHGSAAIRPELASCHHAPDGVVESPMYATLRGRAGDRGRATAPSSRPFPDATFAGRGHRRSNRRMLAVFSDRHRDARQNEFFRAAGHEPAASTFRDARLMNLNDGDLIAHERRIYDFTGILGAGRVLRAKPAKPLRE